MPSSAARHRHLKSARLGEAFFYCDKPRGIPLKIISTAASNIAAREAANGDGGFPRRAERYFLSSICSNRNTNFDGIPNNHGAWEVPVITPPTAPAAPPYLACPQSMPGSNGADVPPPSQNNRLGVAAGFGIVVANQPLWYR